MYMDGGSVHLLCSRRADIGIALDVTWENDHSVSGDIDMLTPVVAGETRNSSSFCK
jgi:hypothetical protein